MPEAQLIVSSAHQVNAAVQPGGYGAAWEVDPGRLVQLASLGVRLLVPRPVLGVATLLSAVPDAAAGKRPPAKTTPTP